MSRVCLFALALLAAGQPPAERLTLEIRVFNRDVDVTAETRVNVYTAGSREYPVAHAGSGQRRPLMQVPAGIYDAQAVQERGGRVINIRWAERLVIMPYPDEAGHHLQVINMATGYGALQIRTRAGDAPAADITLVASGTGTRHHPVRGDNRGYTLFVVPAGQYEIEVRQDGRTSSHPDFDVPLDRTRFWLAP